MLQLSTCIVTESFTEISNLVIFSLMIRWKSKSETLVWQLNLNSMVKERELFAVHQTILLLRFLRVNKVTLMRLISGHLELLFTPWSLVSHLLKPQMSKLLIRELEWTHIHSLKMSQFQMLQEILLPRFLIMIHLKDQQLMKSWIMNSLITVALFPDCCQLQPLHVLHLPLISGSSFLKIKIMEAKLVLLNNRW